MKTKFLCEKCGLDFESQQECIEHEQTCNPMITYVCDKCGKTKSYGLNEPILDVWHSFDFGEPNYFSKLENRKVKFELCDDCLYDFINTFKHKNNILMSNEEKWDERYTIS